MRGRRREASPTWCCRPASKAGRARELTMNDAPLHRLYFHYSELPYSVRVMYTATLLLLGLAYLFAGIYLFHSSSGKDGNPMTLSYQDVVIAYSGGPKRVELIALYSTPLGGRKIFLIEDLMILWLQD